MPAAGGVEFRVLGPFEVVSNGQRIALGTGRERSLLALLALHGNGRLSVDRLIDQLWGESPPPSARKMIQIYVSRLRRELASATEAEDRLITQAGGYRLSIEPGELDLDQFERLVHEGRQALAIGEPGRAVERLRDALSLWRGPPLADVAASAFLEHERSRLEELRLGAVEERIEAELRVGVGAALVDELETLVRDQPLRERPAAQLMLALYRAQRQADALAVYKQTRDRFVAELGIEPARPLKELEQAILRQDPALDAPASETVVPAGEAGRGSPRGRPPARQRQTNLPVQPTVLVGREREIEAVRALVREHRLVTLTGPGGVGKTRLALQAAGDLLDDFHDGVFFVNLAALTDPELVVPTIAQTFALREQPGSRLVETLRTYLTDKRLLLLLDNFEQVAEAAPTLTQLLADLAELKLIVTSRARLHLSGEHEYAVPPLASEEALALFAKRARAAPIEFSLERNRAVVAEICRRLDHLPLAIELAAARIKILPEEALLARLDERLKLLTGGPRDVDERQRTLRATLEWSHNLLSEEEQTLFRRLAVFAGGRTLEAIEAVCNPAGTFDVFGALVSLVDESLLRREVTVGAEPRFVMLETIQAYAREQLDESGESTEARHRHAEYFLGLAEEAEEGIRGAEQAHWNERLARENDNLRAAMRWATDAGNAQVALRIAGAVYRYWFVRGQISEGLSWLRAALTLEAGGDADARAKALHGFAALACWSGQYAEAAKAAEEGRSIAEQSGDLRALARALADLGNIAEFTGDFSEAVSLQERCREAALAAGDVRYAAIAAVNLGDVAMARGDDETAAALTREAAELAHAAGARELEATSAVNLALLAFRAGDYASARSFCRTATEIARELGMQELVMLSILVLAAIADDEGDARRAATLAAAAEHHRQSVGVLLPPNERKVYETTIASAAAALGAAQFEQICEEASALDLDQALAYALGANVVAP